MKLLLKPSPPIPGCLKMYLWRAKKKLLVLPFIYLWKVILITHALSDSRIFEPNVLKRFFDFGTESHAFKIRVKPMQSLLHKIKERVILQTIKVKAIALFYGHGQSCWGNDLSPQLAPHFHLKRLLRRNSESCHHFPESKYHGPKRSANQSNMPKC